ncbi:MAG: glycosyltransferase family 2 protein [Clostridia bacterium]|nr:glycosyltransferase family 2 protein [Clostridia bacterium]
MDYVYILREAIVWIVTIFWIYQFIISLCSLVKLKEKPLKVNKQHKFMAVIPAHNEQEVIVNLIESLKNQNYEKELYDIYVIADNCTDHTARLARNAGAIVYERYDETKKTKGFALDWFLGQKIEENAQYDAVCIFDADNIADKNFLTAMNKKLCQGEEVVQGYRDIKNPTDNWITSGYALFYWTMHKFYHLARYNLGLSPLLNGTGFMVKFDIIKENGGWKTVTLTEDIEFSLQRILKGKRLGWATEAIVYDEQPTGFNQSWSQRSRWTVGHMQCIKQYTGKLAEAAKEHKTLVNFDGLMYIVGSTPMFILTVLLLLSNFALYALDGMTRLELFKNLLMYLVPTFVLPSLTAALVMYIDGKPLKPMLKGFFTYPLFMGSWIVINIKCLFKRQTNWEKITHNRDIKINEVIDTNIQEVEKV